jgi:DNA-binding beta-propeller fold protein YncE
MHSRCSLLFVAGLAAGWMIVAGQISQAQAAAPELKVVDTLKLGGAGRWDYPFVDPEGHRLYIARGTRLQIVDLDSGTAVGDVNGLQGSHGATVVRDKNLGFVTSGRENAVAVFDLTTLKVNQKISTTSGGHGTNPDAILYDPASQKVFVFCGGGDTVVIDPANLDAPKVSMFCAPKLETGQSDGAGHVFVNSEDKSDITVIDSKELKVTDHWPIAPTTGPTGLAIDAAHHRLFAAGGNEKMAVVDSENGKVIATVDIGKGVDGCAFDPTLAACVSANGGDGAVTAVHENSPAEFVASQTLPTLKGGRTITVDPKTHRFYIPAMLPPEGGNPAQFGVVVLGPAN